MANFGRPADVAARYSLPVVLTWAIGAGPIFKATPTDQAAKGATALIILVTLIGLGGRSRRNHARQAVQIRDVQSQ